MNRQQFISELKSCLNGQIHEFEVIKNIKFYEEYFDTEIRNGKSEEQICEMLGSPRLIAKTLIDTSDIPLNGIKFAQEDYTNFDSNNNRGNDKNIFNILINGKELTLVQKILAIVGVVVFFALIVSIFILSVKVLISIIPLIVFVLLIMFLVNVFRH